MLLCLLITAVVATLALGHSLATAYQTDEGFASLAGRLASVERTAPPRPVESRIAGVEETVAALRRCNGYGALRLRRASEALRDAADAVDPACGVT